MPPKPPPPRLTHFLCLPLVTSHSRPQLQASLHKFRSDVTRLGDPDGIPAKAVRPLGTLHLTLGVMSLLSQERVEQALTMLKGLDLRALRASATSSVAENERNESGSGKDVEKPNVLRVTLRGLTSMHTPSKTSILYAAPVDEDHILQSFCQKLRDAFSEADLFVPDTRPLLLHATIVNTIYVPGTKGNGHGKSKAKLTIDARDVLEKYEGFEWMRDIAVEKVAVCRMGAKGEDGEEEYEVEGEVDMP